LLSCRQNARKAIRIANRYVENIAYFRYLGTIATNETLVQDEIKRRLIATIQSRTLIF
jgi:hypothetical protein